MPDSSKNQKSTQDISVRPASLSLQRGEHAQDIQDEIFQKMSADEKLKLVFDFMPIGIELKLSEGTEIPYAYLIQWLKFNGLAKRLPKIK